jgi:hypothetical protein
MDKTQISTCKLNKTFYENHTSVHYKDYTDTIFTILYPKQGGYVIYKDTFILPVLKTEVDMLQEA